MATAIPFTDDESNGVLLDTLEKAQQKAGARRVVAKPSMPRMVGGSGAASQADINELTRAIQGLTETMVGHNSSLYQMKAVLRKLSLILKRELCLRMESSRSTFLSWA